MLKVCSDLLTYAISYAFGKFLRQGIDFPVQLQFQWCNSLHGGHSFSNWMIFVFLCNGQKPNTSVCGGTAVGLSWTKISYVRQVEGLKTLLTHIWYFSCDSGCTAHTQQAWLWRCDTIVSYVRRNINLSEFPGIDRPFPALQISDSRHLWYFFITFDRFFFIFFRWGLVLGYKFSGLSLPKKHS